MTKFKVINKKPLKMAIWAKNPYFRPPGGSKSGENEFSGKKRKRHVLTLPKTKFHAKNQKNLSHGFTGKQGERDRETERQKDRDGPEFKGPPDAIAKPSDQKLQFRSFSCERTDHSIVGKTKFAEKI